MQRSIFLFPGHGSQYPRMGIELFQRDRVFRETVCELDRTATMLLGRSLVESLYGTGPSRSVITSTLLGHAANFCVQYALTRSLIERGLNPELALGMSLGEFVAAAALGTFEARDGLEIVIGQARAIERVCAPGGMLAVFADPAMLELRPLPAGLELIACNGTQHFLVSGERESISAFARDLRDRRVLTHALPVEHGVHSAAIDPAQALCLAEVEKRPVRAARVPIVSAVDGEARSIRGAAHYWSVLRGPMLFDRAVHALGDLSDCLIVDVGPSGTLAGWLRQRGHSGVYSVLAPGHGDWERLERLVRASAPKVRAAPAMAAGK